MNLALQLNCSELFMDSSSQGKQQSKCYLSVSFPQFKQKHEHIIAASASNPTVQGITVSALL